MDLTLINLLFVTSVAISALTFMLAVLRRLKLEKAPAFRTTLVRFFLIGLSVEFIFSGLQLVKSDQRLSAFLGGFLTVTAIQVLLWAVGIRMEILGNVPAFIHGPPDEDDERSPDVKNEMLIVGLTEELASARSHAVENLRAIYKSVVYNYVSLAQDYSPYFKNLNFYEAVTILTDEGLIKTGMSERVRNFYSQVTDTLQDEKAQLHLALVEELISKGIDLQRMLYETGLSRGNRAVGESNKKPQPPEAS